MPPLLQTCDRTRPEIRCRHRADAEQKGTFWRGEGVAWYWLRETRISEWRTCPFCDRDLPDAPVPAQADGYHGEDGG